MYSLTSPQLEDSRRILCRYPELSLYAALFSLVLCPVNFSCLVLPGHPALLQLLAPICSSSLLTSARMTGEGDRKADFRRREVTQWAQMRRQARIYPSSTFSVCSVPPEQAGPGFPSRVRPGKSVLNYWTQIRI